MKTTPGRRLPDQPIKRVPFARGDYMKDSETGAWWCATPAGGLGRLSDSHEIVEHEDGTITVTPSILFEGHWHGWLKRGVWEEC